MVDRQSRERERGKRRRREEEEKGVRGCAGGGARVLEREVGRTAGGRLLFGGQPERT